MLSYAVLFCYINVSSLTVYIQYISSPSTLVVVCISVSVAVFLISWFISSKLYESREI